MGFVLPIWVTYVAHLLENTNPFPPLQTTKEKNLSLNRLGYTCNPLGDKNVVGIYQIPESFI